jgi:hypothetical protein
MRANRTTRKIHAASQGLLTACALPQSRRYVRMHGAQGLRSVGALTGEPVNCPGCMAALSGLPPAEYLIRTGVAKLGPHGHPLRTCAECGEVDEFTSESRAFGLCYRCMDDHNRPEPP